MISNSTKTTDKSFDSLFGSINEKEKLQVETRIIMYRFLSEVERITVNKGISRKTLASMVGTSPSFITQLYKGTKIVNLNTLAKFEKALNIKFRISAISEDENSVENITDRIKELLPLLNSINVSPSPTAEEKERITEIARLQPVIKKVVENFQK
jgi:ribosome-binding protein aMBF1 (putative translation factor)